MSTFILSAKVVSRGTGQCFTGPLGLQLYSLRNQFAKDVPGTLDKVCDLGFTNVELAGIYGMSPEEFKAELDARDLEAVAGHFSFEKFRDDVDGIVREAKTLGLEYVGCGWIPHSDPFSERACREAVDVFNQAGQTLADHGIKFFYHTHGFEFQPYRHGMLFDLIVTGTKPEFVTFEMDVFWVVHAGHDPIELLEKYGSRFQLVHLKDMKDSTPTGLFTGQSDEANDVALGVGKIDYPPILRAAQAEGVKWYFIEDESPTAENQIPESLHYLEEVEW